MQDAVVCIAKDGILQPETRPFGRHFAAYWQQLERQAVERKDVNQDKHLQLWGASKAVCALPTPHGCLHALALMPTPYLYIRRIDRVQAKCMSLVLLAQQVVDSLDGIER